jgi:hypothetical protein
MIDPSTGQQVTMNAGRGDPTYVVDLRTTKFFNLGSGAKRIGVFVEAFNLFNTANFGGSYSGNARKRELRPANRFRAWHRLRASGAARRAIPLLDA